VPILVMAFLSLATHYDERPAASLSLDGERLRIGRAVDCDLRLPDLEVGLRHASLVRQGDSYALVDEGSPYSTWVGDGVIGGVMHPLIPHVPVPLKGLTSARIGPFWLVFDPKARGLADSKRSRWLFTIELLVRKLRWLGHHPFPSLVVRRGPDRDAWFDLRAVPGLPRLVGRGLDADFRVRDACTSREHLEVMCDEDVWVRDLNSKGGTRLGELPLFPWKFVRWRRGTPLYAGQNVLVYESPLVEALEALDRTGAGAPTADMLAGFTPVEPKQHLVLLQGARSPADEQNAGADLEKGPVESTVRPRVDTPPKEPESPRPE
jgi:FHA domain